MTPAPQSLPDVCARGSLWAIVLAGGQGIRLRSLTRHVHGDDRPSKRVPILESRLGRAAFFAGTDHERWALRQAYALAPTANFSRSMLEVWPLPLGVCTLSAITWSDLGTPARVLKMLANLGLTPAWAATLPWPALSVAK